MVIPRRMRVAYGGDTRSAKRIDLTVNFDSSDKMTRNEEILAKKATAHKSYVFGQATDGPLRGSLTHPCFLDDLSPCASLVA